jgi:hypothetical protein
MPGLLVHQGATILCAHAGQAQPTLMNPRVTVSGMPTIPMASPYLVGGCAMPPPPAGNTMHNGAVRDGLGTHHVGWPAAAAF